MPHQNFQSPPLALETQVLREAGLMGHPDWPFEPKIRSWKADVARKWVM